MTRKAVAQKREIPNPKTIFREIEAANEPTELREIETKLDGFEHYMKQTGLYTTEQIRPFNEARMLARWKLGQALAKIEKVPGPKSSRGGNNYSTFLKALGLDKNRAQEAQRIGTLPRPELNKELASAKSNDVLTTFSRLIEVARPYWYKEQRKKRHKAIHAAAAVTVQTGEIHTGPFPLIYADPPWRFEAYSQELGAERLPDRHYPTMTDEEIIDLRVFGKTIPELAAKDAALLMWCTSSNLVRALAVFEGWGFTYKTQAVWDKQVSGMGLVFRNQHEILLYGTRGKMPGPQYQPKSVFSITRGRHSAKPPEVRAAIERMYPDFDEQSRIELFCREKLKGWSVYGLEAPDQAAA